MKFLHTADWQLGMKATHVGQAASRVREERLSAARRVMEAAREHNADFILVAGDTFENNGIERSLIQKAADILGNSPVPVYIIPGNHDPLVPGSVWEHPAWHSMDNLHILSEAKPVDIPGGVLCPCPIKDKHSPEDPTEWIQYERVSSIKIGLAHGNVEGIQQAEPDHPIARNAALRSRADYLALGHWHSIATYTSSGEHINMAYSGTHETTSFGERRSGNVLIVDIPSPGAAPVITPLRTGGLEWQTVDKDIINPGDLASVRRDIESRENPEIILISLQLKGLLAIEDRDEISRIREILDSRFLFGRVDSLDLHPSPQDAGWLENLPPGLLQEAALRMQQLADPKYSGNRPEGASPEVSSRALIELYALLSESNS